MDSNTSFEFIFLTAERSLGQEGPPDDICVFNGKGYLKGQSIPSGDPCKRCVCVDGFNGKINS
jgi:hypothetical protein